MARKLSRLIFTENDKTYYSKEGKHFKLNSDEQDKS